MGDMPEITMAEYPKPNIKPAVSDVVSDAQARSRAGYELFNENYRPDLNVNNVSVWEMALYLLGHAPELIKLMYQLLKVAVMNNDKKTTVLSTVKIVVGIIGMVLGMFKITMPTEVANELVAAAGSLYLIIDWIIGLFTNKPDKSV